MSYRALSICNSCYNTRSIPNVVSNYAQRDCLLKNVRIAVIRGEDRSLFGFKVFISIISSGMSIDIKDTSTPNVYST